MYTLNIRTQPQTQYGRFVTKLTAPAAAARPILMSRPAPVPKALNAADRFLLAKVLHGPEGIAFGKSTNSWKKNRFAVYSSFILFKRWRSRSSVCSHLVRFVRIFFLARCRACKNSIRTVTENTVMTHTVAINSFGDEILRLGRRT